MYEWQKGMSNKALCENGVFVQAKCCGMQKRNVSNNEDARGKIYFWKIANYSY